MAGETKWTPGPWWLERCSHGGAILRRGADDVRGHPQTHLQIVPIEDARLVAAATVLASSLDALLAFVDGNVPHTGTCAAVKTAHLDLPAPCDCGFDAATKAAGAALARARGETP